MLQTADAIHDPVRMRRAGAELLSLALKYPLLRGAFEVLGR